MARRTESNPASGEVRKADTDAATAADNTDAAVKAAPAGDRRMLPSDLEGFQRQYSLTPSEAEQLWRDTDGKGGQDAADRLKAGRVVYRVRYDKVDAAISNPLTVRDNATRIGQFADVADDENRKRLEDAKTAPTIDSTKPESGPHGPFAEYGDVTQSAEEMSEQTGVPLDVADEVAK